MPPPYRVLFVCMGNICRSPMAASVLRSKVRDGGLDGRVEVDSCGTGGWHVGDPADPRARAALLRRGYDDGHRARQVERGDMLRFDLVLAMDRDNEDELRHLARGDYGAQTRIRLLRSFDPLAALDDLEIPDPFYGDDEAFERVLDMVERATEGVLAHARAAVTGGE
ncbi:MAG TPA: low molecular weight protein-tyrosine-phosphatase [Acidimicrobiales bacterium]